MFSTNDEWNTCNDQDILNQSLFGKDVTGVKLLSYTKILNSTTKTTDKTNKTNKRKLPEVPEYKGKKKKKVTFGDNDDSEKKVALSVKVKKKKKKKKKEEKPVEGCTSLVEEIQSGENIGVTTAVVVDCECESNENSAKTESVKRTDVDDSKSSNTTTQNDTWKKKRKRNDENDGERKTAVGLGNTGATSCVEIETSDLNNCGDDTNDFNELYSDSDVSVTPTAAKKKKFQKKKKVDVFVISDSNENIQKSLKTKETQQQSPNTNDATEQKKKLKKKKNNAQSKPPDNMDTPDNPDNPDNPSNPDNGDSNEPSINRTKKLKKKKKTTDVIKEKETGKVNDHPDIQASPPTPMKQVSMMRSTKGSKYNKFQKKLMEKLKGGQFRWINERLYSCKSQEAENMFVDDPNLFHVYHTGFHAQVQQWPQNPVDAIVQYVRQRGPDIIVADFGCGDAKLASSVSNQVHSFDLVAVNENVTACDMRKVPLSSKSVDVAVFCLSLMGTNLVDFLSEAHRVIKLGGVLKIAEVKSRFVDVDKFISDVCSLGFKLVDQDDSNKMFILLELEKSTNEVQNSKKSTNITLNPCIYKRR